MADEWRRLQGLVQDFARARDWEQFHTPKNLVMAIAGEAGELSAELQWLGDAEIIDQLAVGDLRSKVAHEAADVLLYLLRFADVCDFDLVAAAEEKLRINAARYPVELAKGNATKYDRLGEHER